MFKINEKTDAAAVDNGLADEAKKAIDKVIKDTSQNFKVDL